MTISIFAPWKTMSDIGGRIEIISLWRASEDTVSVKILVENPSGREIIEFILLDRIYADMRLEKGEIDSEMLCDIERYAEVSRAYRSACASFAYAPSSLIGLKRKLIAKGFSRDACDAAIAMIESDGFVREDEIVARRAQICAGKLWGRNKILAKLREEGFSSIAIEEAIAALVDTDFDSGCTTVIRKKYGCVPSDRRELEKMYSYLSRQGYSSAEIHKAVRFIKAEDRDEE